MDRLEARLSPALCAAEDGGPRTEGGERQPEDRSQGPVGRRQESVPVSPDTEPDAPIGPSAGEEAAFLATEQAGSPPLLAPAARETPVADRKLPPLETLVARIPAETRAALDELFRAKFTTVRRVPEQFLP